MCTGVVVYQSGTNKSIKVKIEPLSTSGQTQQQPLGSTASQVAHRPPPPVSSLVTYSPTVKLELPDLDLSLVPFIGDIQPSNVFANMATKNRPSNPPNQPKGNKLEDAVRPPRSAQGTPEQSRKSAFKRLWLDHGFADWLEKQACQNAI